MSIISGILAALAAVIITVASVFLAKNRKDRGLIETPEGPLHWPQKYIPLMVHVHPEIYFWGEYIEKACERWNKETNRVLFLYSGEIDLETAANFSGPSPGVIICFPMKYGEQNPHVDWKHNKKGEIKSSLVYLPTEYVDSQAHRIIMHELGHVLGLQHDDYAISVMYPRAIADSFDITAADKEILREWYV